MAGVFVLYGGMVTDIDVMSLITASEAAQYAQVSVKTIISWRQRGHLAVAGYKHGRPAYRLLDVAKAEHATRQRARR